MNQNIKLKEKIELFLNGQLDASQTDKMWAELLASSEDFEYLQTMASLKQMKRDGSLDKILEEDIEKKSGKILPLFDFENRYRYVTGMKKYLVAASLLIIGFAVLFQVMGDDFFIMEQSPIAMIEFETERSAEEELNQTERGLQRAITHSVSGDLQTAFDMLDSFRGEDLSDSERVNLMFVRGSIYYNMEAYEKAAELFEKMLKDDVLVAKEDVEKGVWYLANAQVQLSLYELATQNIHRVIEMDGAFMRPAKGLLKTIEKSEINVDTDE